MGVRTFGNGLRIKTSTKLLVEDTGGDVWRGAIALSHYFPADGPDIIAGRKVLELASGTGLLGLSLLLAECSPSLMVLTDKGNMVELIKSNLDTNADILPSERAAVAELDFFSADFPTAVVDAAPFDVIVVSDVKIFPRNEILIYDISLKMVDFETVLMY